MGVQSADPAPCMLVLEETAPAASLPVVTLAPDCDSGSGLQEWAVLGVHVLRA